MRMAKERTKLTITINRELLENVKEKAHKKGLTLSKLIENFLDFYVNPKLYCFKCGRDFRAGETEICSKCGWLICPHCGACRCNLSDDVASAVYHMRRVYEDLLIGKVK